jgi:hypothetical protein
MIISKIIKNLTHIIQNGELIELKKYKVGIVNNSLYSTFVFRSIDNSFVKFKIYSISGLISFLKEENEYDLFELEIERLILKYI